MVARGAEPIGFSDLHGDEELLIILYREWRRCGAGAVVEHSIARTMRDHSVYVILQSVFDAFVAVSFDEGTWQDPVLC